MKFLSLEIKNFLAVGHGRVKLDDRGLCLIQGVNLDDSSATSNGVGKSTIPDALCWALYGVTARGVSGDAVVNKTAKKNTFASVVLQDGHTYYVINRYRKDSIRKNITEIGCWSDGDLEGVGTVSLTKGTEKDTQEVINQIMGCSLEVFQAAIYAGQEAMPDLPKMTDKQLKLLIEESAGVARLEDAYTAARLKWNTSVAALDSLLKKEANLESQLKEVIAKAAETEAKVNSFNAGRAERKSSFDFNARHIRTIMLDLAGELKKIDEPKLKEDAAKIDKQLSEHNSVEKEQVRLMALVRDAEREMALAQAQFNNDTKTAKSLKSNWDNAEEINSKKCVTCGKPGNEHDLSTFREHVSESLLKAIKVASESQAKLEKLAEAVAVSKEQSDAFATTVPDVTAISARRSFITRELSLAAELKGKILLKNKDREAEVAKANNCETEANPYDVALANLIEHRGKITADIFKVGEGIVAAQKAATLYENVVKVFGPAGVRAHILDTVTPFLNDRTADYLSALSDGNISAVWSTLSTTAKGDLKEKFNIEVTNDKGAESFAGLSGGEKRKVRLSTMLALQDLVASRATKSILLFVCDEIDDALDSAGLERLMGVLERKARDRGTVLIISHNSLSDWCDQITTVTKKDGISLISGSLCE